MENHQKRKEKIKSIAIVFLTVMLILTFFSNTIMNYSLPEVSAQYTNSGQIASKVRGTGTVEAVQPYQVKVTENRKIEEVLVRAGDKVEKGQVLFRLAEKEGNSLEETEEALDTARLEYVRKLYSDISEDALQDIAVKNAREDLEDALEKQKKAGNKEKRLERIEKYIKETQKEIKKYQEQIDDYEKRITGLESGSQDLSTYEVALENAEENVILWENMTAGIQNEIEKAEYNLSVAQSSMKYWEKVEAGEEEPPSDYRGNLFDTLDKLKKQIRSLEGSISALKTQKIEYNGQLNTAKQNQRKAQRALEKAKKETKNNLLQEQDALKKEQAFYNDDLARLKEKETAIKENTLTEEAAEKNVKSAERALETAMAEYNKKQSQQKGQQAISGLELQIAQKKIKRLEEKIAKLKDKTHNPNEVEAGVSGVISAVNYVAGEEAAPDNPLATIQIVEKGYSTKITVTVEQSKKVKEGDKADVLNVWGDDLEVTLTKITSDPAGSSQNKILNFNITGNVEIGQRLDLSVGERSANYDTIVPNSAIHEDSKGKFILVVVVKSSPLGNRYIASRVDVEVLASDDTNSAISGNLSGGDFVITTSTKPIESGMQVRMVEGGAVW